MELLNFLLYLIVAAVCAGIASRIVPSVGKNGFLGSAVLGMIGAWLGQMWLGKIGPSLEGIFLLPAIVGSAVVIFVAYAISRLFARFSKGKSKKPS
ncbi:MAG: GlsB/YeaQ/YmgE family stress response membrane protein [Cyanobacteria bacterium SZAS LIN-2]|nr:GlsB/YeaQ/YmgE family stress response membrane protein [Cyanobacteria bacterium SZAS LIN-3]MBS1996643.1 GlsB/YeaQ/YmgE family stress response membrane protein [Cyanobacteria bacterium SZAS LIN-2]